MAAGDYADQVRTEWEYSVFTFGTVEPARPDGSADLVIGEIRSILQSEGIPGDKIEKVEAYPFLSELVGGEPSDDLSALVGAGGPGESYATIGDAFQYIIDNRDWIYLAAGGGVIGNRADAALKGVVRKLSEFRELRELPALSLQNASIRAKKALRDAFHLPPGTFDVQSEMQQGDDSWISTYHFVPAGSVAVSLSHNDGWLYAVNVRRPNAGRWARDKLAVVHVARSRI